MADTKISALPAATTPLAGTEVLPIVQGGVTEKVAVDDLTVKNVRSNATSGILQVTGPAAASTRVMTTPDANFTVARTDAAQSFTGDQTLSTGNLVMGTSGKGIDFSATPGTGTSELFADYEEGTWTPTVFHNGVEITSLGAATGAYIRIGRMFYLAVYASKSSSADLATGTWELRNLPYNVGGTVGYPICTFNGAINSTGTTVGVWGTPSSPDTRLILVNSTLNSTAWASGYFELYASGCFEVK
jgi:hypothetical protein